MADSTATLIPSTTCEFIASRGLYGSFPFGENSVTRLQELEYKIFVDLTFPDEKIRGKPLTPYDSLIKPGNVLIKFPITDMGTPKVGQEKDLQHLIDYLIQQMNRGIKVYIHCRGGHGRSGLLVALIYRRLYKWEAIKCLTTTNSCHNSRVNLNPRMRRLGSPQTKSQKDYVTNFVFV